MEHPRKVNDHSVSVKTCLNSSCHAGKYSPDEDEKLRNAVRNYVGSKGMSEGVYSTGYHYEIYKKGWAYEIGVERLLSKQRDPELRRAWLIISESLPDRRFGTCKMCVNIRL